MPELPEVQTIVDDLKKKIIGRKITDIWTDWPKYFRALDEKGFRKYIIGKKITGIARRGKNILFDLSDKHLLLIHQKLSGHLLVGRWIKTPKNIKLHQIWQAQKWIPNPTKGSTMDPMNRFIRLIFFFDNGEMLALSDLRRFAKVLCGKREEILDLPDLKNLGPEPLDKKFTFKKFEGLFQKKKGKIKQVLLDQNFISGIGNIYSDEILWLAKIHPLARAENLKEKELKMLYRATKKILKKALKLRGSSIDDYRDAFGRRGKYDLVLYVYQREGKSCKRCGAKIQRLKINSRSAHFCPKCQKL